MARIIYIFNPQNDLCLANGSRNFTPPASSLLLARAGACLPMWYGEPGSAFWGAVNDEWYSDICSAFDIDVTPTRVPECEYIKPWGWSLSLRNNLINLGFKAHVLPSENDIEHWRELSSRVAGTELTRHIISFLPANPRLISPMIFTDCAEALEYISRVGVAMLKLPWSNSGRGQQVSDRTTALELHRRVEGMINRQGAIEISPFYNKVLDFAMLWEDGKFSGYSLFETDTHGGWTHNILLTDNEIENVIRDVLGFDFDFNTFEAQIRAKLRLIAERYDYSGPVGIDFIVAEGTDGRFIVPVEVNWRYTMGYVAHCLSEHYIAEGSKGTFKIIKSSATDEKFFKTAACIIQNHRIVKGKLDLVPPCGDFRFILEVTDR